MQTETAAGERMVSLQQPAIAADTLVISLE